jgi:tetratricopeptide (TPR) repeat protein
LWDAKQAFNPLVDLVRHLVFPETVVKDLNFGRDVIRDTLQAYRRDFDFGKMAPFQWVQKKQGSYEQGVLRSASVAINLGKYEEAAAYYQRARAVFEKAYGTEHPLPVGVLNNEAEVLWKLKRYRDAEPLFRSALAAKERLYAPENSSIAVSLNGLAGVLRDSGRASEAEPYYRRALAIREANKSTADLKETLRDYAVLLKATNRAAMATQYEERAAALK